MTSGLSITVAVATVPAMGVLRRPPVASTQALSKARALWRGFCGRLGLQDDGGRQRLAQDARSRTWPDSRSWAA